MVLFVQLLVVALVFGFRLFGLLGEHLRVSKHGNGIDQLEHIGRHKGRMTSCCFGLRQQGGFPFVVRRERWYHRFLKHIGIAREIQLREKSLDERWYFITDYPDHLERALHSSKFRAALKTMLEFPVNRLCSIPNRLWCDFDCKAVSEDETIKREDYWQALEALREQVTHLPAATRQGFVFRWEAFAFLALHSGLFIVALLGFLPVLLDRHEIIDKHEWLWRGGVITVAVLCLWFMTIMMFFRGTSWAGWVLADFVLVGIIGIIGTTGYVVREVNILADYSAPTVLQRHVQSRQCQLNCQKSCGKNCTKRSHHVLSDDNCTAAMRPVKMEHYREVDPICQSSANYELTLRVLHWMPGASGFYSFNPSTDVYDASPVGHMLDIPLRQGALGIQWVDIDAIQPR